MEIMKFIFSTAIGAALGYGYYKLIGCPNGSCPITSSPVSSTLYGAAMGLFLGTQL